MSADNIPTPPQGYTYHRDLFADWGNDLSGIWLYVWANVLALVPLMAGVVILWLPYQFYLAMGAPLAFESSLSLSLASAIALGIFIVLTSMLLHEALHGLALRLMGYHPILSFSEGFLWAGLRKGIYLTRSHYLIMSLTPLVSMTLIGGLIIYLIPPALGQLLLIALLLNMAASVGDLLVAGRVRCCPTDAMFSDDRGIRVFLPTTTSSVPEVAVSSAR